MCRGEDELGGGGGPERTGGCLDMKEIVEVRRGKIVDGLECEEKDLVVDAVFNGEPMELLQDRCYVTDGGGSGNDTGSGVLNQL